LAPVFGKEITAVLLSGMFAVTCQLPGSVAVRVCCQPLIGFHTSCPTVISLGLPWICG